MPCSPIAVISSDVEEREMLAAIFSPDQAAAYPCVVSAIEAGRLNPPSVYLCGISLLAFGVEEMFALLSGEPELAQVPVVALTLDSSRRAQLMRFGCAAVIELPAENEEIALVVGQMLKRRERSGFHGSFADVALIDLVQLLASSRSNGILDVAVTGEHGEMAFDDGQLIHARINGDTGEMAVLELLRRSRLGGDFRFDRSSGGRSKNIDKRTDHLLLGLASRMDEEIKD